MKLIIDIDKDYYEILKYNVEHEQNYKPWNIIANGKPYEERPQGEWIDAKNIPYLANCSNCENCIWLECEEHGNICPFYDEEEKEGGKEE